MAHKTNLTQVNFDAQTDEPKAVVTDPICGRQMERKQVRHMLFRPDATYYFCSKDCEEQFLHPKKQKLPAAG